MTQHLAPQVYGCYLARCNRSDASPAAARSTVAALADREGTEFDVLTGR
ncbi:MAG TPA: hypothetical protein VK453_21740 [Micromonosporaceae bacterium]|nr:hypothetical protein [Micromonosporaceae bacterium]